MIHSLRMLRHFLAAARTGNLHRAAETECVTQSALSKSLQRLEADMGVPLFERSVRGVTLTKFGDVLYARAARMQRESELIEREVAEMATGRSGSLTIGAGTAWSSVLLPNVLAGLLRHRPQASFTVLRSIGARFTQQLADGEIDVGLGSLDAIEREDDDTVCEPLSVVRTHFLAHKDHPLHSRSEVALEDLAAYPWAVFRRDEELRRRISRLFATNNLPEPKAAISADSFTTVLEVMRLSPLITCLPSPLLSVARSFDISSLPIEQSPWTFQSGVVYRRASLGYPLLEELLGALRSQFGAGDD